MAVVERVYIERTKEYEEIKRAIEEYVEEEEIRKLLRKLARFCTKRLGGSASFLKTKGSYVLTCSWEDEKFASGEFFGRGGLLEIALAGKGLRGGITYLRLPEGWDISIPVTFHDEAKSFTFKVEEEVVDGKGYWKVSLTFGR